MFNDEYLYRPRPTEDEDSDLTENTHLYILLCNLITSHLILISFVAVAL